MIDKTSFIEPNAILGENVVVWRHSHIQSGAVVGDNVKIGENVYIGSGVTIGNNTKIQNSVLLYGPSLIEDQVFIGPAACFTNDKFPRSTNYAGNLKETSDWESSGVTVRTGASIGAGVVCIAPLEIGKWAMVGSGSVVTKDVCAYGLYVGNPAKKIGWVNRDGHRLIKRRGKLYCAKNGHTYEFKDGDLMLVSK